MSNINEYRVFQNTQREKKEQLNSSLKVELKQLEDKHRQELINLKNIHQRLRNELAFELAQEREQRRLNRINKAPVNQNSKGKRKLNEQEPKTGNVEKAEVECQTDNEIKTDEEIRKKKLKNDESIECIENSSLLDDDRASGIRKKQVESTLDKTLELNEESETQ